MLSCRARRQNTEKNKEDNTALSDIAPAEIGQENPIATDLDEKADENILNSVPPTKVIADYRYSPIKVLEFPKHWEALKKDSNYALTEEYKVNSSCCHFYLVKGFKVKKNKACEGVVCSDL